MDQERVFCWFEAEDKVYVYKWSPLELQVHMDIAPMVGRIYFFMNDEEFDIFLTGGQEEPASRDNLKEDFIWFQPGVNKMHQVQCTCGNFLEAGHSMDKLAKFAVRHARRTGHILNPRGN